MTLGVLHLPEVQSQGRELQGIQVEYSVGRTRLSMKGCYRLPAAGTSPSWLSSPTLTQTDGGNERPQCHSGNERPQCHSGNERPWSPDKRS